MRSLLRMAPILLLAWPPELTADPAPVSAASDPEPLPAFERLAVAADTVVLTEWLVPYEASRPRDPYVAPDGRVWFVGQRTHYAAVFDPASGEFEKYDLEPGTGPHNLIVDAEGIVWYAGNRAAHIGRLDPGTGEITKIVTPDPPARDPHTLVFDGAENIWFTVQGGNVVGWLERGTEQLKLVPVPTQGARPYGIVVDANGRPWISEFGTNKIGTVDPETMELEEIELPRGGTRPRRLVATSDGVVWYVDYAEGYLGRLDPETREVREWRTPSGAGSRPYAMAVDDRDRIWFVETGPQPNRFVGFDPATESWIATTEIESGGGVVRHMYFDPGTRAIWFGTDTNYLGRAQLP